LSVDGVPKRNDASVTMTHKTVREILAVRGG